MLKLVDYEQARMCVCIRLRVIKGHTVIYHAPNHPIPKSMSPFLYRKLPKVNRSSVPRGDDDAKCPLYRPYAEYCKSRPRGAF